MIVRAPLTGNLWIGLLKHRPFLATRPWYIQDGRSRQQTDKSAHSLTGLPTNVYGTCMRRLASTILCGVKTGLMTL